MTQSNKDVEFIKRVLPGTYSLTGHSEGVRCKSEYGIEDEGVWKAFFKLIKKHFDDRFQEVYHNTCTNHVDFIIYLKP